MAEALQLLNEITTLTLIALKPEIRIQCSYDFETVFAGDLCGSCLDLVSS